MIVNSCPSSLEFNAGTLSKYILESAGIQLQREALLKYPKGINHDEIAVTSACQMKNCIKLYHVTCPRYDKNAGLACSLVRIKLSLI